MASKLELYGFGSFDSIAARQPDVVQVDVAEDRRRTKAYYNESNFANAEKFAHFTARDIPHPKGKRIS